MTRHEKIQKKIIISYYYSKFFLRQIYSKGEKKSSWFDERKASKIEVRKLHAKEKISKTILEIFKQYFYYFFFFFSNTTFLLSFRKSWEKFCMQNDSVSTP